LVLSTSFATRVHHRIGWRGFSSVLSSRRDVFPARLGVYRFLPARHRRFFFPGGPSVPMFVREHDSSKCLGENRSF
jgi:hypothetical protein